MVVELLKCPKGLESELHPRVPWPRYSTELAFWHSTYHESGNQYKPLELLTVGLNAGPVRGVDLLLKPRGERGKAYVVLQGVG